MHLSYLDLHPGKHGSIKNHLDHLDIFKSWSCAQGKHNSAISL